MATVRLEVNGMSCQHCVKTVTDALTTLDGVQHVKVNLRKGEAVIRFDASRITDTNLTEVITEVGFEAVTKTEPLSLRLIGGILITLFSIASCSDMPYTGSMLTAEDVDKYITIGEDSACLLSGYESVCITLIPETEDDSRPVIHIHPRKLIYVFYYEGVQIMQAEMVTDTTEIMEQMRDPGEADQPPSGDGGVRDDSSDDDGDSTIDGGGDTQQPGDGSRQQPGDGGTQQPGDGSGPRSDGGNGGTPLPPPPPPTPPPTPTPPTPPTPPPPDDSNNNNGGNQNGDQNGGNGGNDGNTETKIKVQDGTDEKPLVPGGLIDLRLRTGQHATFECLIDQQLDVIAYTDIGLSQKRAHQHWSACKDDTDNVIVITIFLDRHPALTCDVGPNIHYLEIQGVTEPIIITEFNKLNQDTEVDCPEL